MNFSTLRQHQQPWALALVLALLLLTGWGQVHRVLHPGAAAWSVESSLKATGHALAHEDGSSLCQLLDHLSHDAGPAQAPLLALLALPPALPVLAMLQGASSLSPRHFDARAPPASR